MFVLCDNLRPLSQAVYYPLSYIASVCDFALRFPNVQSANVYRDVRGSCRSDDLMFMATLSRKSLDKILSKYSHINRA